VLETTWSPSSDVVAAANSTRFAAKNGLAGYEELLAHSTADPSWFWGAMAQHFDIAFDQPYDEVLDERDGIEWARWFRGGRLNLAFNCIDRDVQTGRGEHVAVRAEGEDGALQTPTYAELRSRAPVSPRALPARDIESGDRVAPCNDHEALRRPIHGDNHVWLQREPVLPSVGNGTGRSGELLNIPDGLCQLRRVRGVGGRRGGLDDIHDVGAERCALQRIRGSRRTASCRRR
jgi:hypothetical protein